jgi:chemotaxis protein histidine kinase CheA
MGAATPDPMLQVIFETEVSESVATMQDHLLRIEEGPADRPQHLAELLRLAHDIKGSARVVGAVEVARLAHALEARLLGWRDPASVDPAGVDLALSACDLLGQLSIDAGAPDAGNGAAGERRARARELVAALDPGTDAKPVAPRRGTQTQPETPAVAPAPSPPGSASPAADGTNAGSARGAGRHETLRVTRSRVEAVMGHVIDGLAHGKLVEERYQALRRALTSLRELRGPKRDDTPRALARFRDEKIATTAVVCEAARKLGDALREFLSDLGDMDRAAYELCVVPCAPLVGHLERVARDAAAALGRRVRLDVEGRGIELDKALVDELKGPLTHAVRNAVDHGIEGPEERTTAGKAATGVLRLVLREDDEAVRIVLSDDGRGIDRAAVAARLGDDATGLDDRGLLARLLRAGVSTRDTATELSGRGIGLGALAALADRLRGDVTLTSQPGQGTTVSLRLPARYSLLDALTVESGGLPLVIPMSGVCRIEPADDRVDVPSIARVLGFEDGGPDSHVLTLQGREKRGRFAIGRLGVHTEVVQRPVGAHLQQVPFASGVTVLPSGSPAWVLDPRELVDACSDRPGAGRAGLLRRILLVDDSRALRTVLHGDLVRAGYDVVLADDGLTALDRIEAMTVDAVVSDVQMPRLDGLGLLLRCRDRLPVVLITTDESPETARRARELGAAAFLVKDPSLGSRVEAVLADIFSRKLESNP